MRVRLLGLTVILALAGLLLWENLVETWEKWTTGANCLVPERIGSRRPQRGDGQP
jgi:hypothetical protein